MIALNYPMQAVDQELIEAKLIRAIYSDRQLQEVMTDFWMNHFNVFIGKEADRYLMTGYERDVIRPHALGKFEDLLIATAQSPAMLFYLDNWLSEGPNSDAANGVKEGTSNDNWRRRAKQNGPVKQSKGKRERPERKLRPRNDGTSNPRSEWRLYPERCHRSCPSADGMDPQAAEDGRGYTFDERKHEPGDKVVLGHRIKPKGEKEGLEVLHLLAHHPSTAKFVCTKLAMRFVSDNPPPALVDRMSQNILKKRRRHSRSVKDNASLARVLVAGSLPGEGQNPA